MPMMHKSSKPKYERRWQSKMMNKIPPPIDSSWSYLKQQEGPEKETKIFARRILPVQKKKAELHLRVAMDGWNNCNKKMAICLINYV